MITISQDEYSKIMSFLCGETCDCCMVENECDNPTCVINRIDDILSQHIEVDDSVEEDDLPF